MDNMCVDPYAKVGGFTPTYAHNYDSDVCVSKMTPKRFEGMNKEIIKSMANGDINKAEQLLRSLILESFQPWGQDPVAI
jgi:hypothetical protein